MAQRAPSDSVSRNGFPESERGDARRRLEDKPPYLALGVRMSSAGRAGCPQPAAVEAQGHRARKSLLTNHPLGLGWGEEGGIQDALPFPVRHVADEGHSPVVIYQPLGLRSPSLPSALQIRAISTSFAISGIVCEVSSGAGHPVRCTCVWPEFSVRTEL